MDNLLGDIQLGCRGQGPGVVAEVPGLQRDILIKIKHKMDNIYNSLANWKLVNGLAQLVVPGLVRYGVSILRSQAAGTASDKARGGLL